jgi:hypothetical protein
MADPQVLVFEFNGQPIRFPVGVVEMNPSPFTGRDLRTLKTEVTVSPADAEIVKALLASAPATDADGARWTGNLNMESYTNDGPHQLTITWTESEHVRADLVEFEGLALTPTRYEERTNNDGSIAIAFQATLTEEETKRLRSLIPPNRQSVRYWPVVRRGVSDDPRSMRLGRVLWEQLDDGLFGHDITLVDEAFDTSDERNALLGLAGEPMVGNLVRQLSSLLAQFETLLAELEASGHLTPEVIARIRESAESLGPDRRHAFFEVSDISKW